ncbi:MAG: DUF1080 domain-containing protein [Bacteroidota bacterium]
MKTMNKLFGALTIGVILAACSAGYVELFDGKTLEGWACNPPELASEWRAEDGMILGENVSREGSILWTTRSFRDFEVEFEYMTLSDDYDSGLFLRGESHQVQIGISRSLQEDLTGCIYAPVDEQGSYPGRTDKVAEYHQPGTWNHLRVIIRGKRIQTFLNGEPFVDYQAIHLVDEGPVGLQLHGGVQMEMKFRNIRLRELSQDPANEN